MSAISPTSAFRPHRWLGLGSGALLVLVVGCRCTEDGETAGRAGKLRSTVTWTDDDQRGDGLGAVPRKGRRLPDRWAKRPSFRRPPEGPIGLRCLPDGELNEWTGRSDVRWLDDAKPVAGAKHYQGRADLHARLAFASYPRGLSVAIEVKDDRHRPATHLAAFAGSDHVELRLTPVGGGPRVKQLPRDSAVARSVGVALRLGTRRQLIEFRKPVDQAWRAGVASAAGVDDPAGGYRVEARLPLSVLTPLTSAEIPAIDYEVIVHDGDDEGQAAEPTLRFAGRAHLGVAMALPEAAQRRLTLRVCLAAEPEALWGYRNGWRCAVPDGLSGGSRPTEDDRQASGAVRFGYHRVPEPPVLQWLRERLIFVNLVGANRGIAALVDRRKRILSVLPVGVVGGRDPGNARAHDSDAAPFKLPDGTWAVALTYAYPSPTGPAGGRCAGGHRVYASIIAARGAPESTPHKPAPEPDPPPHLEEVFRLVTEDCVDSRGLAWSLSKDRRVIQVRDLVFPSRPVRTFVFNRAGWYEEQE